MKFLIGLFALLAINNCPGQTDTPVPLDVVQESDASLPKVHFFEDFNDNKRTWTIGVSKRAESKIDGGLYYLTALGHAYGEAKEVKIDTRRDFEIESRIKIVKGRPEHKLAYSMIFWGRKEMISYYLTFAGDGFTSVELCDGKRQSDCMVEKKSFKKTLLAPDGFNVYTVRKVGRMYFFLVNGSEFYRMPFTPFFGDFIGFGAGRKVTIAVDYLKVSYL